MTLEKNVTMISFQHFDVVSTFYTVRCTNVMCAGCAYMSESENTKSIEIKNVIWGYENGIRGARGKGTFTLDFVLTDIFTHSQTSAKENIFT